MWPRVVRVRVTPCAVIHELVHRFLQLSYAKEISRSKSMPEVRARTQEFEEGQQRESKRALWRAASWRRTRSFYWLQQPIRGASIYWLTWTFYHVQGVCGSNKNLGGRTNLREERSGDKVGKGWRYQQTPCWIGELRLIFNIRKKPQTHPSLQQCPTSPRRVEAPRPVWFP